MIPARGLSDDAVPRLLQARWGALQRPLMDLRRSNPPAESIRKARVASRRLRVALRMLAPALADTGRWRRELARLGRALGAVRDLDVQIQCLDHWCTRHEDLDEGPRRLMERLRTRREGLLGQVRKAWAPLEDRTSTDLPPVRPGSPLDLGEALAHRGAALLALGPPVPEQAEACHRVRVALKQFRYALELTRDAGASGAEAHLPALRSCQDQLGALWEAELWRPLLSTRIQRAIRRGHLREAFSLLAFLRSREALAGGLRRAVAEAWEALPLPELAAFPSPDP